MSWQRRGIGAKVGEVWMGLVGLADDMTIMANGMGDLCITIGDIISVFNKMGFKLSAEKCD